MADQKMTIFMLMLTEDLENVPANSVQLFDPSRGQHSTVFGSADHSSRRYFEGSRKWSSYQWIGVGVGAVIVGGLAAFALARRRRK